MSKKQRQLTYRDMWDFENIVKTGATDSYQQSFLLSKYLGKSITEILDFPIHNFSKEVEEMIFYLNRLYPLEEQDQS